MGQKVYVLMNIFHTSGCQTNSLLIIYCLVVTSLLKQVKTSITLLLQKILAPIRTDYFTLSVG